MAIQTLLQAGTGLGESAGQLVGVAASVILLLMLVALGGFAYKSLRGDGIRCPDEEDTDDVEDGSLQRADDDEEWDYY